MAKRSEAKHIGVSRGAARIEAVLKGLGVIYYTEFTFEGCRDKRMMPYDFMVIIEGKTCLIEYDGEQHFKPSTYFNGSRAAAAFEKQVKHDLMKNDFSKSQNISLLRIGYLEDDNIERHLRHFLTRVRDSHKRVESFCPKELYPNPYSDSGWSCIII